MELQKSMLKDIDENIRPIIIKLNQKNYLTVGCCEGHEKKWKAYIAFKHNYDFPLPLPQIENLKLNSYPMNQYMFYEWEGDIDNKLDWLNAIDKWVDSLPYRELYQRWFYVINGIPIRNDDYNYMSMYSGYDKEEFDYTYKMAIKSHLFVTNSVTKYVACVEEY